MDAAKQIAQVRCLGYDVTNVNWQQIDALIDQQDYILARITDFNEHTINQPPTITAFLNKLSPEKKISNSDAEYMSK